VGLIDAGTGNIGIEATAGDLLDARTDTVGVGTNGFATQTGSARTVNLTANNLVLRAGDDIGTAGNALDTTVNTLAAIAGSDLYIYESDALTIGSISAFDVNRVSLNSTTTPITTTALSGITATGGDVHMRSTGDLTVLKSISSVNGVVDETLASGETITLESVDGNILIDATGGSLLITTDEVTGSKPVTGDKITLLADSNQSYDGDLDGDKIPDANDPDVDGDGILNAADAVINGVIQGRVSFLGEVTLSTDGGVAKKFGPRPQVGATSTAFFQYVSNPLPLAIDNSPAAWSTGNAYINAFSVLIGQSGEENLTVDIDWQDPSEESGVFSDGTTQAVARSLGIYNKISSERIQQFLVEKGGPSTKTIDNNVNGQIIVGHLYTALDYTRFQQQQNRTTIIIDLSVSHHSSINLSASSIAQSGEIQTVPGLDAASTDIATTVSDRGSATPDVFENGIASFKIPTVTPAPPALFTSTFVPRADRPFNVAPPENQAAVSAQSTSEFGSGAVGGSVFSTEVYFQIRRQYETDGPAEVVVERIADSSLISSREAFEKFVQQNPELQDGAGYEIWLISETGGQKVERPIVEFEISGGQPGTMNESVPEGSPKQKLKDLPFEQPTEPDTAPEAQAPEIPQASMNRNPALHESAHNATSPEINNADREVSSASGLGSDEESSTLVSEALNPSSVALVGLMVRRFRKRQQESATSQSTFSRASRFQRRHSSPNAEFEVRGSSDV
jgi:hypothetical protein